MKRATVVAVVLAVGLVTAGCSDDKGAAPDPTEATADATSTTDGTSGPAVTSGGPDAVVDVEIEPGVATDGFVGARGDVTLNRCERVETGWAASGEVTNGSGADAAYRIYVALNVTDTATTRGLVQVDAVVADGETQPWEVTVPVQEQFGLVCILRVERVPAS